MQLREQGHPPTDLTVFHNTNLVPKIGRETNFSSTKDDGGDGGPYNGPTDRDQAEHRVRRKSEEIVIALGECVTT